MIRKIETIKKYGLKAIIDYYAYHKNVYREMKLADTKKMRAFRNIKSGKRCFIIGNGPSLSIDDLEKMKNEDSFAVNRIYKIFSKTEWRPTFYFSQDTKVLEEIVYDLEQELTHCQQVFLNAETLKNLTNNTIPNNYSFFYLDHTDLFPQLPRFSENPAKKIYEGFTVAYACIQMAVYMGYSEIYIIGTDHSYTINRKADGTIEKKDGVTNYMPGLEGKLAYPPQMEKSTLAFRKARQVCDKRGIIIKNATRGGMLEEFERVDFDSLFE